VSLAVATPLALALQYCSMVNRDEWYFCRSADGDGVTSSSDGESCRGGTSAAATAPSSTIAGRRDGVLPVDDRSSRRSGSRGRPAAPRRPARPSRSRPPTDTVRRWTRLPPGRVRASRFPHPHRPRPAEISRRPESGRRRRTNSTSGSENEADVDRKWIDDAGEAPREQFLHRQSARQAAGRPDTVVGDARSPQVCRGPASGRRRLQAAT